MSKFFNAHYLVHPKIESKMDVVIRINGYEYDCRFKVVSDFNVV